VTAGTTRFLIIVGLVGAGLVVLLTGFSGGPRVSATGTGTSPSQSTHSGSSPAPHSRSPNPPIKPEKPKDITFVVLNGTTSAGLAGQWQTKLENAGFTTAHIAANAPSQDVQKTIVYFSGGGQAAQNKADASFLAGRYFRGAAVRELSAQSADASLVAGAKVVIVIGADTTSNG